jgi:eukaryotic-like serine/threonine-protein kinase
MSEEDLFHQALAKPAGERAAFLDRECAGDAELRQRLAILLQAHAASGSFLDQPAATGDFVAAGPSVTGPAPPTVDAGTVVAGRYKLLEPIGEGGMGAVWVAEQTQPVRRKVALKLIKPGMDSKQVLARFEAERQALALMDHPNIAKVLDGGLTDDRRPFFVMEYVKGVPITEYCDAARLSVPDRLALFAQVCQAVQHAHQKGIIHRDLKPSNILVAPYDGRPVPKVIDFGLAKALHQPLTDRTLHTGHETVLGTPLYMAPEQAQLNNLDVDTRADVYSLGVLLYELLTGTTPLERKRFREAAWDEIRRLIREEEPPRPSARLSSTDTLPSLAASRQMEPARLTKLVRGELDWIVMKALEKDRNRRYETANGFAMDVQRYLAGEPVLAAPPSRTYQLRKLLRRHRPQVVAAGLVILALLAGFVGTAFGLVRADQRRRDAEVARQGEETQKIAAQESERKAKLEAAIATAVKDYLLEDLFRFASISKQLERKGDGLPVDPDMKVRDLVLRAAQQIEGKFKDQPLVEAEIRQIIGWTLWEFSRPDLAIPQQERVRDIYTAELGPAHPDTLRSMQRLGMSYYTASGRIQEAKKLLEETLALMKAHLGNDHIDTLRCMHFVAMVHRTLGHFDRALELEEETFRLMKAHLGPAHLHTLESMSNLGVAYHNKRRIQEAIGLLEETLRLTRTHLGQDHPVTLGTMHHLSWSLSAVNRRPEAIKLLEEVVKVQTRTVGLKHVNTHMAMLDLGAYYWAERRQQDAIKSLEGILPFVDEILASGHATSRRVVILLGNTYVNAGRVPDAIKLQEKLVRGMEGARDPDNPDVLRDKHAVARLCTGAGKLADALALEMQVVETWERRVKANPADAEAQGFLALALGLAGQAEEALSDFPAAAARYDRAIAISEKLHPEVLQHNPVLNGNLNQFRSRLRFCRKAEQAVRDLDFALKQPEIVLLMDARVHYLLSHNQLPAAVESAAKLKERAAAGGSEYPAARAHAACAAAAKGASGPSANPTRFEELAGEAMSLLKQAAAKGLASPMDMKQNADFDALRDREDFKKLLAELERPAEERGPDDPQVVRGKEEKARQLVAAGNVAEAVALATEVVESRLRRVKADPGNPTEQGLLAAAHAFVGYVEAGRYEFAAAAAQYSKAVAVIEKMDPAALASQAIPRNNLQNWRQQSAFYGKAEQAVRDLDFALKQPEKMSLLDARVHYLLKQHQLPTAVESAAKMKELIPKVGGDFWAARAYAACAGAAKEANSSDANAPRFDELAAEAMSLLKQAAAKGLANPQEMKRNTEFDVLRSRDDFKKLLAEVEAKVQPAKKP